MKIQLKSSNVLEGGKAKAPTPAAMEYGELAVNYNTSDPSIFLKDSSNNIVKIADGVTPGNGTITIKQPGLSDQSFTVNQTGNTEINLLNDNSQVTPGNGALSIVSFGSGDTSTGSFTANQAGAGTITLPQIDFGDLKNVPPSGEAPGDGALSIASFGSGDTSTGTFTANQSGPGTITLPQIDFGDLKNVPPASGAPGNGTITVTQQGTSNQTFTVNQSGNTTIALRNDNTVYQAGQFGLVLSGITFDIDISKVPRLASSNTFTGSNTFTRDALINDLNIGRGAGNVNTNTALGQSALQSNTTGSQNTAVGISALANNTQGIENTGLGRGALLGTTIGNSNTAVGRQALLDNNNGSGNTAVGRNALTNNISGNNNTAVGRNAGLWIKGDGNTILGAYEGNSADETLNNTVIIASAGNQRMRIKSDGTINLPKIGVYFDNNNAKQSGLAVGDVYRKTDGTLMITY